MSNHKNKKKKKKTRAPAVTYTEEEMELIRTHYRDKGPRAMLDEGILGDHRTYASVQTKAYRMGLTTTDRAHWRRWTLKEDTYVKEKYKEIGAKGLIDQGFLEDRTLNAIRSRAKKLKVTYNNPNHWSPSEVQILKDHYHEFGASVMVATGMIEGRGEQALTSKAQSLGLTSSTQGDTWTPEEEAIMRKWYPTEGPGGIYRKALLGSERTYRAIQSKATVMGLGYGNRNNQKIDATDKVNFQKLRSKDGQRKLGFLASLVKDVEESS